LWEVSPFIVEGGFTDDLNVNTSLDKDVLCDHDSLSFLMLNCEEMNVNVDYANNSTEKDDMFRLRRRIVSGLDRRYRILLRERL
jgi:hypothetical protein